MLAMEHLITIAPTAELEDLVSDLTTVRKETEHNSSAGIIVDLILKIEHELQRREANGTS